MKRYIVVRCTANEGLCGREFLMGPNVPIWRGLLYGLRVIAVQVPEGLAS